MSGEGETTPREDAPVREEAGERKRDPTHRRQIDKRERQIQRHAGYEASAPFEPQPSERPGDAIAVDQHTVAVIIGSRPCGEGNAREHDHEHQCDGARREDDKLAA